MFGEYTVMHLLPFMENQITTCITRVDAVCDRYTHGSLKNQTQVKRLGETAARRIRVSQNVLFQKERTADIFES